MLDLSSDSPDDTCLMVKEQRSFLFHRTNCFFTQKTVRFPTPITCIIAKTQFCVARLSIRSMNSHYYCKNAHAPVGFLADGT